jgi:hypothetical protein
MQTRIISSSAATQPPTPSVKVAPKPAAIPEVPKAPTVVGKTIKSLTTSQVGSVFLVDLFATDGAHYYIKNKQGVVEIGGRADWDTGTKVA